MNPKTCAFSVSGRLATRPAMSVGGIMTCVAMTCIAWGTLRRTANVTQLSVAQVVFDEETTALTRRRDRVADFFVDGQMGEPIGDKRTRQADVNPDKSLTDFGPDVQAMRIREVVNMLSRRFRQLKGKERRGFAPLFGHVRNGYRWCFPLRP